MTPANQKRLEDALVPFLDKARKASGASGRRSSGRSTSRTTSGTGSSSGNGSAGGVNARAVRAWAQANNVEVNPRGRISSDVLEKYRAANA